MADINLRPAHLAGFDAVNLFAENLGFAAPPRVSFNDGWRVMDEAGTLVIQPSLQLKVIMLAENDTRIYYPPGTYDASNPSPPTCFSDDKVRPSANALQQQSELCANCPRAVWDQPTPKGNLVPACDSRYKVAVLVAGAGQTVFMLTVPPASRKAYEVYRRYLQAHNAPPYGVVTEIGCVDKAYTFEFKDWVNAGATDFIKKVLSTDEPGLIVGLPSAAARLVTLVAPPPPPAPKITADDFAAVNNPPRGMQTVNEPPKRKPGRPPVRANETFVPPGPIKAATFGPPPGSGPGGSPAAKPTPKMQPATGFGMVENPPEPSEDIQAALSHLFGVS